MSDVVIHDYVLSSLECKSDSFDRLSSSFICARISYNALFTESSGILYDGFIGNIIVYYLHFVNIFVAQSRYMITPPNYVT